MSELKSLHAFDWNFITKRNKRKTTEKEPPAVFFLPETKLMPAGLLKCADGIEYPILFSLLSPLSSSTSTSARLNAMSLHHLQCGGHGPDKD